MNKIVLLGKLIKDPELKTIENGEKVFTRFIIAVDRNFKSADGTRKADLIPVTIWGRKAEVVCKYMRKGSYISLSGINVEIQKDMRKNLDYTINGNRCNSCDSNNYKSKQGNKKYIAEVVAEDFKFVGNKRDIRQDNEVSGGDN